MLIAELSGQGFLGFCAAVTIHFVFSVVTSYQSWQQLWPSSLAQTLTAYFSLFLLRNSGDRKGDTIGNVKKGIILPLKIYIIHSTFCWLIYSCAPSTQHYWATSPGWVLLSRLGQNYETVIVGHALTPGWAQDRGGIQNTVSSMGQYSSKKSGNIFLKNLNFYYINTCKFRIFNTFFWKHEKLTVLLA